MRTVLSCLAILALTMVASGQVSAPTASAKATPAEAVLQARRLAACLSRNCFVRADWPSEAALSVRRSRFGLAQRSSPLMKQRSGMVPKASRATCSCAARFT